MKKSNLKEGTYNCAEDSQYLCNYYLYHFTWFKSNSVKHRIL